MKLLTIEIRRALFGKKPQWHHVFVPWYFG